MKLHDILLNSAEVKKLFVQRSTDYQLPLKYICSEAGVDFNEFMQSYVNSKASSGCSITEDQFMKMLSVIGVNVKYTFIIDSKVDMNDVSRKICDKYLKLSDSYYSNKVKQRSGE